MLATLPQRYQNEDFGAQNQASLTWCVVNLREPEDHIDWRTGLYDYGLNDGVREKAVAKSLSNKGIECYLPMLSVRQIRRGQSVTVKRPLYPFYLFAAFSSKAERHRIREHHLVKDLLYQPEHTQEELSQQIADIRTVLKENPSADSTPWAKDGVKVIVTSGPFMGIRGEIIKRRRRIKGETIIIDLLHVGVTLLGRVLEVEIDPTICEPI